MGGWEQSDVKGSAVAASYLFVVFFNILRIERLVVSVNSGEGRRGEKGDIGVFTYVSQVTASQL